MYYLPRVIYYNSQLSIINEVTLLQSFTLMINRRSSDSIIIWGSTFIVIVEIVPIMIIFTPLVCLAGYSPDCLAD